MSHLSYFERLVASVTLIARHADFPGKHEAVDRCKEELGDLRGAGVITADQEEMLLEVLTGELCPAATWR